jgi:hypothetical protein
MTETPSSISLWVGHATSPGDLDQYLHIGYTKDGDEIKSPFAEDFGIEYYDDDSREADFVPSVGQSISALLAGCSYDTEVIPEAVALIGDKLSFDANVFVMLLDFAYDGRIESVEHPHMSLKFVGIVRYTS